jgi:hypothetical protein
VGRSDASIGLEQWIAELMDRNALNGGMEEGRDDVG